MPSNKDMAKELPCLIHTEENPATALDFDCSHLFTASAPNGPTVRKISTAATNVSGEDGYKFHHPPLLGVDCGLTKYLLGETPSIEQTWMAVINDKLHRLEVIEAEVVILLLLPRWTLDLPDGSPLLIDLTTPRASCIYPCVWLSPERLWNMTPGVITIADF